ncbi:protein of unknown function [Acidithiobacillus ferrivorans]|uniref:Uncharacterized protein n=1 Tax=Acidithiobacillus ferrivorans TaxID=160808 RepID=A0A060UPN7_9PROT|nr:hypothetical protein [Acidithiobacillus ferrivorans]CDQ10567.1 hypothetical protein AFERRI_400348 [Acidithiobacillus ferrivorans]SMH64598.1 protein of unknown function [Acidithiobacillus ferrivorans]
MSLPKKSFAREIIAMRGYSNEEEIVEVACIDGVSHTEAARRVAEAREQSRNRSMAQRMRHWKAKNKVEAARRQVLSIAHHRDQFLCADELENIGFTANWKAPDNASGFSYWDTGRVFREICRPLEKAGMLQELRKEDRFVGYTITDAGRKELLGEQLATFSGE